MAAATVGTDGRYVWAEAAIENQNSLRLTSTVAAPAKVIYQCWKTSMNDADRTGNDWCNLYGTNGMPAYAVYVDFADSLTTGVAAAFTAPGFAYPLTVRPRTKVGAMQFTLAGRRASARVTAPGVVVLTNGARALAELPRAERIRSLLP